MSLEFASIGPCLGNRWAPKIKPALGVYSTVTLFAKLRGLSTSVPFTSAAW